LKEAGIVSDNLKTLTRQDNTNVKEEIPKISSSFVPIKSSSMVSMSQRMLQKTIMDQS